MTYYKEVRADGRTWHISLNNILMAHCNLGWNGSADGWYIYGIFNTNHPFYPDPSVRSVTAGGWNFSVNTYDVDCKKEIEDENK
jgi:hypothetical protein